MKVDEAIRSVLMLRPPVLQDVIFVRLMLWVFAMETHRAVILVRRDVEVRGFVVDGLAVLVLRACAVPPVQVEIVQHRSELVVALHQALHMLGIVDADVHDSAICS